MSESLIAVPLDPASSPLCVDGTPPIPAAPLLHDFDCGDEPFEKELARWIRDESLEALGRGAHVWLYFTAEKELVGFGSLATTRWHYPESEKKRVTLAIIPAVAMQKKFWGKPDGPRENRYSSQILDHLIVEAAQMKLDVPLLALFVHPQNQRAVKVYERAGFSLFSKTYLDKATNIEYRSMIRLLVMAA
jgi:RimJ/RimL family protein N-acetyltransferase